jgi:hypothetical protein
MKYCKSEEENDPLYLVCCSDCNKTTKVVKKSAQTMSHMSRRTAHQSGLLLLLRCIVPFIDLGEMQTPLH